MLCEETRQSLSLYIDDCVSLPTRVAIDEHLDRCPVCRAEVAELRSINSQLASYVSTDATAEPGPRNLRCVYIEAAARKQAPNPHLVIVIARFLQPRLMPYTVGSFASVIMFVLDVHGVAAAFRAHCVRRHVQQAAVLMLGLRFRRGDIRIRYDIDQPVTPESFAAQRAPFGESRRALNPERCAGGPDIALTRNERQLYRTDDDMLVVADVFSNGAPRWLMWSNHRATSACWTSLNPHCVKKPAFVPASLDRRPTRCASSSGVAAARCRRSTSTARTKSKFRSVSPALPSITLLSMTLA